MGRDDNTSLGAREFGATLALPVWIDYMRTALKGVAVTALPTPAGVQEQRGDWVYDEYAEGGYIAQLGMEPGNPPSIAYAPRPGEAASGPADGASDTADSDPIANFARPDAPAPQPGGATPLPPQSPAPVPRAPQPATAPDPGQRLAPALR